MSGSGSRWPAHPWMVPCNPCPHAPAVQLPRSGWTVPPSHRGCGIGDRSPARLLGFFPPGLQSTWRAAVYISVLVSAGDDSFRCSKVRPLQPSRGPASSSRARREPTRRRFNSRPPVLSNTAHCCGWLSSFPQRGAAASLSHSHTLTVSGPRAPHHAASCHSRPASCSARSLLAPLARGAHCPFTPVALLDPAFLLHHSTPCRPGQLNISRPAHGLHPADDLSAARSGPVSPSVNYLLPGRPRRARSASRKPSALVLREFLAVVWPTSLPLVRQRVGAEDARLQAMSVFSMIKRGRQAAKEHRAEQAEREKKEAEKPPYRHIPKHAAIDALSGGPAGWREHDRRRIVEQNRRRSAMTASGVGMSGVMTPVHAGIMPRVHSSLSHVSYPSAYASPVVQLPRNHSSSSVPPGWTPHTREASCSPVDVGTMSLKGKEVERARVEPSATSRSSSKMSSERNPFPVGDAVGNGDAAASPVDSSSSSSSSQDDLEMKPARPVVPSAAVTKPDRPVSDTETIHRLHPGCSRRISDPNQPAAPPRSSFAPRTSSLAPGVPPVPAIPPQQLGTALTTTSAVSSSAASTASSVTTVPVSSAVKVTPTTAAAAGNAEQIETVEHQTLTAEVGREREDTRSESIAEDATISRTSHSSRADQAETLVKKGRRISKTTRSTKLETTKPGASVTVDAAIGPCPKEPQRPGEYEQTQPSSTAEMALPTSPGSPASLPLQTKEAALPPPKPNKLSKSAGSGARLVKKNRWSLKGGTSAAVAG